MALRVQPVAGAILLTAMLLGAPAAAQDFSCPRPLVLPDLWNDLDHSGQWNPGDYYDAAVTGFQEPRDLGLALTLAPGAPPATVDSRYLVVDLPPLGQAEPPRVGTDWVTAWFSGCTPYTVTVGDSVQLEPGLALDQVTAGVQAFLDQDPDAVWDEDTGTVSGSAYAVSPRVMTVMAYDPSFPPLSGRNYVRVRKLLRLFVESMEAGPILHVRVAAVAASGDTPTAPVTWGRLKTRYVSRDR